MKQRKYTYISGILSKLILFGKINKSERYDLEAWLSQSNHNSKICDNVCDGKKYLDWKSCSSKIDVTNNWNDVYNVTIKKSRIRKLMLFSISATIIILFMISVFLLSYTEKHSLFKVSNNSILVGSYKASLLLDDGLEINLNDVYKSSNSKILGGLVNVDSSSVSYEIKDDDVFFNKYHTISVPRGGEYMIKFNDGSSAYLNSQTRLRYPVKFNDSIREVFLEGEAYFKVKSDKEKPFIVRTKNEKIRVLGTEFNVRSYNDEKTSRTTLVVGEVEVSTKYDIKRLKPSEQAILNILTNRLEVKVVNPTYHISWIDNYFAFNNQRLETIMKELSRWYNFDVIYTDDKLKDIRFGGKINRTDSIEAILRIISATNKVKIKVVGTTIVFRKNNY